MITKPVPVLLCTPTGHYPTSRTTPELATALAVRARRDFPNEQTALKCGYMAIMPLDPTSTGQARWTMRWKTALNVVDITLDGRLSAVRQQPTNFAPFV